MSGVRRGRRCETWTILRHGENSGPSGAGKRETRHSSLHRAATTPPGSAGRLKTLGWTSLRWTQQRTRHYALPPSTPKQRPPRFPPSTRRRTNRNRQHQRPGRSATQTDHPQPRDHRQPIRPSVPLLTTHAEPNRLHQRPLEPGLTTEAAPHQRNPHRSENGRTQMNLAQPRSPRNRAMQRKGRSRMGQTGETYQQALQATRTQAGAPRDDDLRQLCLVTCRTVAALYSPAPQTGLEDPRQRLAPARSATPLGG